MLTKQSWAVGDPEPSNDDVRQVRGRSGTVWERSEPAGLFWCPREGGIIRGWEEMLDLDAPLVADRSALPLTLFDLPAAAS